MSTTVRNGTEVSEVSFLSLQTSTSARLIEHVTTSVSTLQEVSSAFVTKVMCFMAWHTAEVRTTHTPHRL